MYIHDPSLEPYIREHWPSDAVVGAGPTEDASRVRRAERRQDPRFTANVAASVHSLNPLTPEYSPAQVVDVSKRGLKLRVLRPIQPGTEIQIRLNRGFVLGEIRYCVQAGSSYFAGVLVDDVFWSHSRPTIASGEVTAEL